MGGPSSERDVSLASGRAVAKGLREAGYGVTEVEIEGRKLALPAGTEAVFIAMHGEYGEDGELQDELRRLGMPYTGSGPEASRAGMDKRISKRIFVERGIPTAAYEVLTDGQARTLPLPVVVKPPCGGSSIGCQTVTGEKDWPAAIRQASAHGDSVLVEAFVAGRELTAGVVGRTALPIVEIVAPGGEYSYAAKYTKGASRYLVPAPLPPSLASRCQATALRVFDALGCRHMGRVDMRLTPEGELVVLEMNSIPGFTETSLLPKAAAAAGIGFPALCARIMEMAEV
jgi:D-alanine-D-alanine ligase